MSDQLVCRMCHHPLLDEAGCFICLPIKPHLMPVELADEESVPLAQLAAETAKLLRAQLKQLALVQKASSGYDPVVANESRAHAAALAKLLDAARKVIQDGADAVDCMSFQEKAALFVEWFASLPPAYKRSLHEQLGSHISLSAPVEVKFLPKPDNDAVK